MKFFRRVLIVSLVGGMLNGALFNRIGSRIAEQSYLLTLLSFLSPDEPVSEHIKVSKRSCPTNTGGALDFSSDSHHQSVSPRKHMIPDETASDICFHDPNLPTLAQVVIELVKPPV